MPVCCCMASPQNNGRKHCSSPMCCRLVALLPHKPYRISSQEGCEASKSPCGNSCIVGLPSKQLMRAWQRRLKPAACSVTSWTSSFGYSIEHIKNRFRLGCGWIIWRSAGEEIRICLAGARTQRTDFDHLYSKYLRKLDISAAPELELSRKCIS